MAKDIQKYAVLKSVSRWNPGDLLTADQLEEGEVERLTDLAVIRTSTQEEIDAETARKKEIKETAAAARKAAEDLEKVQTEGTTDIPGIPPEKVAEILKADEEPVTDVTIKP